jgi:hypothetical protein
LDDRLVGAVDLLAIVERKSILGDLAVIPRRPRLAEQVPAHGRADGYEDTGELQPEQAPARVASDLPDLRIELVDLSLCEEVLARHGRERTVLGA